MKECPKLKQFQINKKVERIIGKIKNDKIFVNEAVMARDKGISSWRREILRITPRYLSATYDDKQDVVVIEYLGSLQNVVKYYSETSVIAIRNEVKQEIEKIRTGRIITRSTFCYNNNQKSISRLCQT